MTSAMVGGGHEVGQSGGTGSLRDHLSNNGLSSITVLVADPQPSSTRMERLGMCLAISAAFSCSMLISAL